MEQGWAHSLLAPVLAPRKRVLGFSGSLVPRVGTRCHDGELSHGAQWQPSAVHRHAVLRRRAAPWRPLPLACSSGARCTHRPAASGRAGGCCCPSVHGRGGTVLATAPPDCGADGSGPWHSAGHALGSARVER